MTDSGKPANAPEIGHGMADEVMEWLDSLRHGRQTEVMARGKHYHFNCDKGKHYVYEVDESRREQKKNGGHGRKKRVYIGVMASARNRCQTESTRWEVKHSCHDRERSG